MRYSMHFETSTIQGQSVHQDSLNTYTHMYCTHILQSTHNLKEDKLLNVWWEVSKVVVTHVQGPQAFSQVREVGRERGAGEIVVS